MARTFARIGLGAAGLLAGLGAPRLAAQSWALPASDPVGIARSGAGVAFGNNLEAAALNPALLATLRDGNSAYVSYGMELQAAQATLQANQQVQYSVDRNRSLPALGAGLRISTNTYIVGFSSAARYYGDGGSLSNVLASSVAANGHLALGCRPSKG